MKVQLSFMKIDAIRAANGFYSETIDSLLTGASAVPSRTVECAKLKDVEAAIEAYRAECEATGLCGRVFTYDKSPRGVRACPGFKKLKTSNGGLLVNDAVGWAAGKAKLPYE